MEYQKYAVLGGGSWATAIVKMLCENLDEVFWYMRNSDAIDYIHDHGHNPNYLTSVTFDTSRLRLTDQINEVITRALSLIHI